MTGIGTSKTNPVIQILDGANLFIRAVETVVFAVTHLRFIDALLICANEHIVAVQRTILHFVIIVRRARNQRTCHPDIAVREVANIAFGPI